MSNISIELWFDDNAEEAVDFYTSVFKDSKVISKTPLLTDAMGGTVGAVLYIEFELNGQRFGAVNGGPLFKPNEAVSIMVHCQDQDEIDYYWNALSAVPDSEQCGWLKDKFGVSWQIAPEVMGELMTDPDVERATRVQNAMLAMKKLDIAELEKAAAG